MQPPESRIQIGAQPSYISFGFLARSCKKMRVVLFFLATGVSLALVFGLPNTKPYKKSDGYYHELARELVEEVLEEELQYANTEAERENSPPYLGSDQARGNSPPYKDSGIERENNIPSTASDNERDSVSSYKESGEHYLQLAREVADQYMEDKKKTEAEESRSTQGVWTAEGALRAFNRQGRRTQQLSEKLERENAELETLQMLTAGDDPKMLRQLQNIDLTARRAQPDPMCDIRINCSLTSSRNFIGSLEFRTINGSCNNLNNYTWGMAGTQHRRLLPDTYRDGRWATREFSVVSPPRTSLPSPRNISNVMHNTSSPKSTTNSSATLAFFYFAQLVDHDVAKTPEGEIPTGRDCCTDNTGFCMALLADVPEDYFATNYCMPARRSFTLFRCNDTSGFQNQINEISAYIDGSMVYGSTDDEEAALRAYNSGYLKESTREFMPNSTRPAALHCRVTPPEVCYEAGDTRNNVHPGLTSFHNVFVRQHNRIAKQFSDIRPTWTDERVYQETRKFVGAQIQHLVYNEFLPVLIRKEELDKYSVTSEYSYNGDIDASMTQAFSIAFRYHNLMPDALHLGKIVDEKAVLFEEVKQENVFLKPSYVNRHHFGGIDEVALGFGLSSCPHANRLMNDATRNLLFLDEFGNSFDLAALNIARGREWGMPSYTEYRTLCGLGNATTWDHLLNTTSKEAVDKLKSVYRDVRDVDAWVGFVSEDVLPGSLSGPTQSCLVAKHFANLKHGDRFFYTGTFRTEQLTQIREKTTLARILCDNLNVSMMRKNVFNPNSDWLPCSRIIKQTGLDLNLESWV